ncbi:MAG: FAD-dependent oxidoreductase [Alphaproteobacteria bacterium]|nr:FAD-dependent oxidoreductase [Alphaproteobacteria bacterium]
MRHLAAIAGLRDAYDLVIVGAGPAGMVAAATASGRGISVLVVDEAPMPGGQIYRAVAGTRLPRHLLGRDYRHGGKLVQAFSESEADYLPEASVWHLDETRTVGISLWGEARLIAAQQVILATGAIERPMPIAGWTLPGVIAAGGAQSLLKASGLVPSGRTVLAGMGPLLWLLAAQYIAAGAAPALILDTTPQVNRRHAARHLAGFLLSPYATKGLRLIARVRRRVRVLSTVEELSIGPVEAGLRVTFRRGRQIEDTRADTVLIHQGVAPNLNLAAAAGCALEWNEAQACWQPQVDLWGGSSVAGIAIAGDGAGIVGAEAAAARGELAALEALRALQAITAAERGRLAVAPRTRLRRFARGRAFLDALYRPSRAMRLPAPEALACRCEEVTGRQLADTVRELEVVGPNQLKAFLRCGMGPCQGRFCGATVTEAIAAARGVSPAEIGYMRLRSPVKPITLAELAAMPSSEADRHAVVRG